MQYLLFVLGRRSSEKCVRPRLNFFRAFAYPVFHVVSRGATEWNIIITSGAEGNLKRMMGVEQVGRERENGVAALCGIWKKTGDHREAAARLTGYEKLIP